ncbi:MAG: hypothetical protein JO189_14720 [Deltaproteobacteria bacterium]|nr:hypothetical protein [Deltaproteobacteria bacterium]
MDPWYKVVQPRTEVREGRSFNLDEFAIGLKQVVAGIAPQDYTNPANFFALVKRNPSLAYILHRKLKAIETRTCRVNCSKWWI